MAVISHVTSKIDTTREDDSLSHPLTLDIVTCDKKFRELENDWNTLAEQANLTYPFLTFTWVRTWWECFGKGRELRIVVVRERSRAIGIAPLMLSHRRFYGWKLRSMEFISNVHTPRFDFLIAPDRLDKVYEAIWSYIASQRGRWDVLLLCQLPAESASLGELSARGNGAGLRTAYWMSANSPFVPISGDWKSYLNDLKSKHRVNLERRLRRLQEHGDVAVEFASQEPALDEVLSDALRLEAAAWKGASGTSISSESTVARFYRLLALRLAEKGWLNLHFLSLDGRRIAMQYAVSYKNRAFSLKPGYDPAYGKFSPSNLLLMLFLEKAFGDGMQEYDLLGVDEEWKRAWTKVSRKHYWLFIFSNALIPALIYQLKFKVIPRIKSSHRILCNMFAELVRTRTYKTSSDNSGDSHVHLNVA